MQVKISGYQKITSYTFPFVKIITNFLQFLLDYCILNRINILWLKILMYKMKNPFTLIIVQIYSQKRRGYHEVIKNDISINTYMYFDDKLYSYKQSINQQQ